MVEPRQVSEIVAFRIVNKELVEVGLASVGALNDQNTVIHRLHQSGPTPPSRLPDVGLRGTFDTRRQHQQYRQDCFLLHAPLRIPSSRSLSGTSRRICGSYR